MALTDQVGAAFQRVGQEINTVRGEVSLKANSGLDLVATYTTGDFNALDLSEPGLYRVRGGSGFVTNLPNTTAQWWNVVVLYAPSPADANTTMMLATSSISNTAYYKAKYGSTWGAWVSWANLTAMAVSEGTAGTVTSSRAVRADYLKQIINFFITGDTAVSSTAIGQAVAKAVDAAAARTAIGAVATDDARLSDARTPTAHTHLWADITDKPATFAPSTHSHVAADLTDSTTIGRSLVTAADAAAARTLLEIPPAPSYYEVDLGDGDDPNGAPVDRTAEVQQAFAARSARLGPGVWRVSAQVPVNAAGCDVLLDGARIITSYTASYPFTQDGSCPDTGRSARAITAGAVSGSTVITTDTAGMVVGDWIMIRSSDAQENDATALAGMIRRVRSINGSDVTLDIPLYRSLPTTPLCVRIDLAGSWRIFGTGSFEHADPNSMYRAMIRTNLAERPFLDEGIVVGPNGGPAVQWSNTIGGVSKASFIDLLNFTDGGGGHLGYGVNDGGCSRYTSVIAGTAQNIRHAYTTNNTTERVHNDFPAVKYGEPEDFFVGGEYTAVDSTDAGFDTHEPGRRGVIEVRAVNCSIGAQDRATDTTFFVKNIAYPTLYGIHIAATSVRSKWHDLRVVGAVPGTASGQAYIRARAATTVVNPSVPEAVTNWAAVNNEAGADVTFLGSGQVAGPKSGAGAIITAPVGLSASSYDPAAQTDIRTALANYGLVPAGGNLGLSIGTGTINSGTVLSTATVQGRLLRGVGTAAADIIGRFDGITGQTGDLLQARVNGSNKFAISAAGATYLANTTTPATPASGATLFANAGTIKFVKSDGTVVDLASPSAPTWDSITGKPTTFAPSAHTHPSTDISDSTATGRAVLTATDAAAARTAIGAGTSSLTLGTTAGTAKAGDYAPTWTEVTSKPATFPPSTHSHIAADLSDSTTVGRAVLTATDAAAARTAIGAGTSSLVLGTTSTTAKAGDYQPTAANISDATATGRSVLTAVDAASARTAIGAGTSNLALGTTASTAKAGNYAPTWTEVTSKPSTFAPSAHTHPATDLSDSTATGRSLVTAADAAAARTAIGAGTSSLALGTTAGTAKAGDYQPAAANISDSTTIGRTVLTAVDAAAVRTAIAAVQNVSGVSGTWLGATASLPGTGTAGVLYFTTD